MILEKKLLIFYGIIVFCCLKLNAKQNTDNSHKILTSKQMIQRLPIAISKAKTANASENLLNKIRQTRYSL